MDCCTEFSGALWTVLSFRCIVDCTEFSGALWTVLSFQVHCGLY